MAVDFLDSLRTRLYGKRRVLFARVLPACIVHSRSRRGWRVIGKERDHDQTDDKKQNPDHSPLENTGRHHQANPFLGKMTVSLRFPSLHIFMLMTPPRSPEKSGSCGKTGKQRQNRTAKAPSARRCSAGPRAGSTGRLHWGPGCWRRRNSCWQ